ncbi:MAG: hypothetical protein JSV21_01500 [Nitrospirota bacterium]|nr:MAG: hypothetical protein JSV21_01500 [Nitrospirota bacterium]
MSDKDREIEELKREISRLVKELSRLSPQLSSLLKMRGYHMYKTEPPEPPILPGDRFVGQYYDLLKHYSFRLFLRDVIRKKEGFSIKDVSRFTDEIKAKEYTDELLRLGIAGDNEGLFRLNQQEARSFGPTLEWFVAEVLHREYGIEAKWGLRFKRANVGGDYDVIAKMGTAVMYIEVKSSPPKQVYQSEISAFFKRIDDLFPEIAVFLMDTELRMKDKIVPMFEEELSERASDEEVVRMEKELFQISNRIFIINSKGGIDRNIEKVLRWYFLYNR